MSMVWQDQSEKEIPVSCLKLQIVSSFRRKELCHMNVMYARQCISVQQQFLEQCQEKLLFILQPLDIDVYTRAVK